MATWRLKDLFKADATACENEINSLPSITPENILEYARNNEESELHKCFEWDDSIAAEKYRLMQARRIVQNIVYEKKEPEAAVVRKYEITSVQNTYAPIRVIRQNEDEYQSLLKRACAEAAAFKNRYCKLVEFDRVFAEIDELLQNN